MYEMKRLRSAFFPSTVKKKTDRHNLQTILLEIETKTQFQAHLASIGKVIQTNIVIQGRFQCNELIQEKGITDFRTQLQVVHVFKYMLILQAQA